MFLLISLRVPGPPHNMELILPIASEALRTLQTKYGFKTIALTEPPKIEGAHLLAIQKNDLVFFMMISELRGCEIFIKKSIWKNWRSITPHWLRNELSHAGIKSFAKLFDELDEKLKTFENRSVAWYECAIQSDIDFIKEYFAFIFEKGELPKGIRW